MLVSAQGRRMGSVLLVVAFLGISRAAAQPPQDVVIGQQLQLHSEILGEARPIQIHLPDDYGDVQDGYPLLIALDGEDHFGYWVSVLEMVAPYYVPQMIIVGLPNTNRSRDLLPPNVPPSEGESGAQRFLRFLEQELVPYVEARYRTHPYRILAGHSVSGLFTLYAWVQRPDLFQVYIASSPGLDAPERRDLLLAALRARKTDPITRQYVYLSGGGDEPQALQSGIREFDALLATLPGENLEHRFDIFEGEGHVPVKGFYQGLRGAFPTWWPAPSLFQTGTLEDVKSHYAGLSQRYGFPVSPPADVLHSIGGRLLRESRGQEALEAFQYCTTLYPRFAAGFVGLGWAYRQTGEIDGAVHAVGEALRLDPGSAAAQRLREALGGLPQR